MCLLNYFSLSWPSPPMGARDLWTLAAVYWWIIWSDQLAVLVQHSENNYQSRFTFTIWVTLSSQHVTSHGVSLLAHKISHVLWYCQGRKCSWGHRLLGKVWLLFLISVWKSPGLNLRLLCSAREGKSVDRLVMMDLNDQNSLLIAPAKNWVRIERREGRPKSPALDSTANFLL